MNKNLNKIKSVLEVIFGIAGIAMIVIETFAVFSRNFLHASAPWTDETLKVLFVWVIFICGAVAFLDDGMIAMTLIEDVLSKKKKVLGAIKIFQFACALVLSIALSIQSTQIVNTQIATGAKSAIMGYPLWFTNLGFLIGNVLTIVFAVYKLVDCKKFFSNKNE